MAKETNLNNLNNLYRYNITLDKNLVNKCKDKMKYTGSKLSPILNNLLTIWLLYPDSINNLLTQLEKEKNNGSN